MTKMFLVMGLVFFSYMAKAQVNIKDSLCYCSVEMKSTSYFWKKDSLANNGYRLLAVRGFDSCKLDKVDRKFLIAQLGHPNRIRTTNNGIEYLYYYYDYRKIPKKLNPPSIIYYISFKFKDKKTSIEEITKGHTD